MGHACGKPSHRQHFFRLDDHFFDLDFFRRIINADDGPFNGMGDKGVYRDILIPFFLFQCFPNPCLGIGNAVPKGFFNHLGFFGSKRQ